MGGACVVKSWTDFVGADGGGEGLSLHSHFTQKTSEMSANASAGFENRDHNESFLVHSFTSTVLQEKGAFLHEER